VPGVADNQLTLVLRGQLDKLLGMRCVEHHRLLDQHMQIVRQAVARELIVRRVRRGDHDAV
jgi:hypothetical protein